MNIVKLTDSIGVSAQITPEDVADIAAAGYKVLINNRPDGEENDQPSSAAVAAAAQAAGLEYHHIPITAQSFPGPHFDAMSDLLDDPDRPVLAFCRTGTRCANLWVASREDAKREAAMSEAAQRGYDLGMAVKFLDS
ncbi:Beta-lactamase hydrolase-like protein [Halioglobus japonicus]|nr:Beta-lactamase hydrolase-like protein [Halioglobus japonicus]